MPLPRLLMVDDDPDVCEMVRLTLRDHYDVAMETDGRRALERLAEIQPEIAIVDLVMPGADGLTVCARIKSERPDTIVVVITATTKGSDLPDSFWRLGTHADAFLTKPFDPQRLVALLHELRIKSVESRLRAKTRDDAKATENDL